MVVTRKNPVVPPTPVSRTNSSQPLPRSGKSKAAQSSLVNSASNGDNADADHETDSSNQGKESSNKVGTSSPQKNSKLKPKQKSKKGHKKSGKKPSSFTDLLARALLLFFTIYTLSVCPNDQALERPVCRGLYAYRHYILEPYLLPPIQMLFRHPSVAPYVATAKPHFDHAVATATPILLRTKTEWNNRVVPQWNKRVIPQWNKFAVPQIARVESAVEPYRLQVEEQYEKYLARHVRVVQYTALQWAAQAEPYLILAASKTNQAYDQAKPYAIPVLRQIQALLERLLEFLQAQRREFVDPHVARIWEKVVELSSRKPKAPLSTDKVASKASSLASSASNKGEGSKTAFGVSPLSYASSMAVMSTSTVVPAVVESTSPTAFVDSDSTSSSSSSSSSSNDDIEILKSASSIMEASAEAAPSIVSSLTDEIKASTASIKAAMTEPSAPAAAAVGSEEDSDDIDLDEFYAELGLNEPEDEEPEVEATPPPPVQVESPEEKEERLEKQRMVTAKKRADIEKRHTKWEEDMEVSMKAQRKELRKKLVAMRKANVQELKDNVEIKAQMDNLVSEGDKLLKGAESFLKNMNKDKKPIQEKIPAWNKVMTKIEAKFEEKLSEVETIVQDWHAGIISKELQEVDNLQSVVQDIADRAQSSLGMDYAWLDDVTYMDWQRYHDLPKKATDFKVQLITIQNGSHPSPPINPIIHALDDLSSEVDDIVRGFDNRLQRIKRSGERALGLKIEGEEDEDERAADEPQFSILPIVPEGAQEIDTPPIFIGRSEEEVVEALGRLDLHDSSDSAEGTERSGEAAKTLPVISEQRVDSEAPVPFAHVEL